ncbi:sigma-54 interaction domain-containing protein [Caldalkalibacillus mannanilyticus]|uniref:sigma-54 interaction domain-containing protein n=1 Tax=Caldalkalibacillus mannanilyticus TaxID=1418 RepID=UPI00046A53E0|nr:sigma-54-dependent Fis family transcriptional regulator [Caldalkalibacillus mannanilyticus]
MRKVLIVGAGRGGTALLKTLRQIEALKIIGIADHNVNATGMMEARKYEIPTAVNYQTLLSEEVEIIIDTTGREEIFEEIRNGKPKHTVVIPGSIAQMMMGLIDEKENLIEQLKHHQQELTIILNSTYDGMIAVNKEGLITLFNRAAERMIGITAEEAVGERSIKIIPNSRLDIVLQTGQPEINHEQYLYSKRKIITNRVPVINQDGEVVGAVAVFRDVTDVTNLTEEVTELKRTQSILEAIINSSDDAISVVNEHGIGWMINPAYTRLTGLSPVEVLGKPAETDIYEGESMHMKVLKLKRAIRGVHMKVGKQRREVLVNVAPVMVDGEVKGSVGIVHDISEIKKLTAELDRARRIIRRLEAKYTFEEIIGDSRPMRLAIEQAKKAAATPATVLLRGESGTGKELFAHAIHNESERKYNQFIRVNCAALSDHLLESELFGYEEGAFTGARRGGKQGLFEEANGGTIFLDEIGEISLNTQAKLLRVLQEKEIVRVGGTKSIAINVRIIAATNVHLEKAIQAGAFREDLYYRLNVLPIHVPSLRERQSDMDALVSHLLRKYNLEYGRQIDSASAEAILYLKQYHWPGNVRELENVISRAIINMKFTDNILELIHLPPLEERGRQGSSGERTQNDPLQEEVPLEAVVQQAEKTYLEQMLRKYRGNKTIVAKKLQISVRNLYYKLSKYELT